MSPVIVHVDNVFTQTRNQRSPKIHFSKVNVVVLNFYRLFLITFVLTSSFDEKLENVQTTNIYQDLCL